MMNILLPTDFSENSRNAAVYALQFFREIPCKFFLLHVMPFTPGITEKGGTDLYPENRDNLEELADWLNAQRQSPDHSFHIVYKTNYLIEAVREIVQEKQIDLILMSTRGNSKGSFPIGRNTLDVMTKVKCPVLAISNKAEFHEFKEILFPTDYKIRYNSKMLETLLNLSSLSRASVKILELFSSESEPSEEQIANRAFLQGSFSPKVPALQTTYAAKNDTAAIFNENSHVDMVVMAAKNLNICHKLLRQKQGEQLSFINKLPLLVLHG